MTPLKWRRVIMAAPILIMIILGFGFWRMLQGMREGAFDPHAVNVPGIQARIPAFDIPSLMVSQDRVQSRLLTAHNRPVLINFFASWCIPCVAEMPQLRALSREIEIWGVAYKDRPENARSFVLQSGSPYTRVGQDVDGALAMDLGVTGVPENLLIMPGGRIVWRDAAPMTRDTILHIIRPLLADVK